MNVNDSFPSNYLKASDLQGRALVVSISHVEVEAIGRNKEQKPVVYFTGKTKGIVLNKTNARKTWRGSRSGVCGADDPAARAARARRGRLRGDFGRFLSAPKMRDKGFVPDPSLETASSKEREGGL